jgi:hypothetical protein
MPISNSLYSVNTGRDNQALIVANDGRSVDLQSVTMTDSKMDTQEFNHKRLDGNRVMFHIPEGFSGSIEFARMNPNLDLFFDQLWSDWINNGLSTLVSIYYYVAESDGSQTCYHFIDATLKYDAGKWSPDKEVNGKIDYNARAMTVTQA